MGKPFFLDMKDTTKDDAVVVLCAEFFARNVDPIKYDLFKKIKSNVSEILWAGNFFDAVYLALKDSSFLEYQKAIITTLSGDPNNGNDLHKAYSYIRQYYFIDLASKYYKESLL